jgi:hypothetical protein
MSTSEETQEKRLKELQEVRECKSRWRPVSARTTRSIATAFSSGVDWGGSSKGSMIDGMAKNHGMYSTDWPKFKEAMDKAVGIEESAVRELMNYIGDMIEGVRGDHE